MVDTSPQRPFSAPSNPSGILSQKNIVVGLSGAVALLGLALIAQIFVAQNMTPQTNTNGQPTAPVVVDPNSNTASRYFPGGGNAIDFHENGSEGAFSTTLKKSNGTPVVGWDDSVSVANITMYDIGELDDLQDHHAVWSIGILPGTDGDGSSLFLPNPYTIGELTTGFTSFVLGEDGMPIQNISLKGKTRYVIEVTGTKDSQVLTAYYTFDN